MIPLKSCESKLSESLVLKNALIYWQDKIRDMFHQLATKKQKSSTGRRDATYSKHILVIMNNIYQWDNHNIIPNFICVFLILGLKIYLFLFKKRHTNALRNCNSKRMKWNEISIEWTRSLKVALKSTRC